MLWNAICIVTVSETSRCAVMETYSSAIYQSHRSLSLLYFGRSPLRPNDHGTGTMGQWDNTADWAA